MLWDIEREREIKTIPHRQDYEIWISRLSDSEISQIKSTLNGMIDGTRVQTSSWMPGADWRDSAFQVIYEKAAKRNPGVAAKCFGIFVWEVFMERPEKWASGHYEKDGVPIEGRTYFQIQF